jgi:hypothetical protein
MVACSPEQSEADWTIEPGIAMGAITPEVSETELSAHYGAEHVVASQVSLGEGESAPGTILFPEDSLRRATILWSDTTARRNPAVVILTGDTTVWRTREGVSLGTTLAEFESLNGGPFTLLGFEWDYSGSVTSWRDGALAAPFGQSVSLFLLPLDSAIQAAPDYREVMGDRTFESSHPVMQALNPRVYRMEVHFDW